MGNVHRRKAVRAVALVAALALAGLAAGCSGGDDSNAGVTTDTTAAEDAGVGDDSTGTGDSSSGGSASGSDSGSSSGSGSDSGSSSGSGSGGGSGSSSSGSGDPAPAAATPSVALTGQKCNSGKLIVSLTANASSGYRKGISSVTVARQNEYGAFLTQNASWLGPETGAGNVWNGTLVGNSQNIGKTLRIIAKSDGGQTKTAEYQITAPC
jgi:hypothetical protein